MLHWLIRGIATALHKVLALGWFVRRPRTFGAHAAALTPAGELILVKLWYAPYWRLPGGGRPADEPAVDAAIRELREEIGMTSHGETEVAGDFEEFTDYKRDLSSLVIVREVDFRPKRWSWEVERVGVFRLDELPADLSPQTRRWLKTVASRL
jgi:8-oxo-dGTP pyrophosphatase MutT (NUDIX family)